MFKTQKDIPTKHGFTLPKGLPVTFKTEMPSRCFIKGERDEPFRVRVTSAFRAPSLKTIEKWNNEGFCKSIAGERVEPDGWDSRGTPSWLLALSLI
jgi:hypothetical protein